MRNDNKHKQVDRLMKLQGQHIRWLVESRATLDSNKRFKYELRASKLMRLIQALAMKIRGDNPGER